MTRYVRKDATVEAVQWTGDIESIKKIEWVKEEIEKENIIFGVNDLKDKDLICLINDKSDQIRKVETMDYIIKCDGRIGLISEGILKELYEPIEDTIKSKTDLKFNLDLDTTEAKKNLEELKRSVDGINNTEYTPGIMKVVTKDEFILKYGMKGMKREKAIEMWNKISKGYNFALSKDASMKCILSIDYLSNLLKEKKDLDCTNKEQEQ